MQTRPVLRFTATCVVALVALNASVAGDGDPLAGFDAYVAKAVQDWRTPGLAIAVVKDGRVLFSKGYGVRELGKPAPVDEHTLFAIGSTTKAMTAALVGMLVDEKKLAWDDPVVKHLPWFQMKDPYLTREITVRDLLTHRAGLGNADYLWYGQTNEPREILRRVRLLDPSYSLRSSFIYQNVMYAAAGQVIAAASGMPWEEFIRTRIFAPLHMNRTVPLLSQAAAAPNVASPHDLVDDTMTVIENASVDAVRSAGSVWSSVADMAKWARFILDSARVDGKRLLKPETFAELLKPQTMVTPGEFYPTARLTHPHWTTYGLGWFQEDYNGRAVDFHTGSIDGMVAIIGLIPDERLGVYVLANADHVELRHALMYKVFDLWGPTPEKGRDWSTELRAMYGTMRTQAIAAAKAAESKRVLGTKPSLPLARYVGTYADSLYGEATVTSAGNGLRLEIGTMKGTLEHWQYDTFRVRWDQRWQGTELVRFVLGNDGNPARIEMGGRRFGRSDRGR